MLPVTSFPADSLMAKIKQVSWSVLLLLYITHSITYVYFFLSFSGDDDALIRALYRLCFFLTGKK
jgi:hypothetical protein